MLTTQNSIMTNDKKVKPNETTTVWGTGTSKHIPKGKEITVHVEAANTLIAQGRASATQIEAEPDTKKKKV